MGTVEHHSHLDELTGRPYLCGSTERGVVCQVKPALICHVSQGKPAVAKPTPQIQHQAGGIEAVEAAAGYVWDPMTESHLAPVDIKRLARQEAHHAP